MFELRLKKADLNPKAFPLLPATVHIHIVIIIVIVVVIIVVVVIVVVVVDVDGGDQHGHKGLDEGQEGEDDKGLVTVLKNTMGYYHKICIFETWKGDTFILL